MATVRIADWERDVLEKIQEEYDSTDSISDALNEVLSWYGFQFWCVYSEEVDIEDYWKEFRNGSEEEKKEMLSKLIEELVVSMDKIKSKFARLDVDSENRPEKLSIFGDDNA